VVIISMLLFCRNRATNAFQLLMGVFLASSEGSRPIIDTFNHTGISVKRPRYVCVLSQKTQQRARSFVRSLTRLWAIVYDNINFRLQRASQRLDSGTQQLNATTLTVFSLQVRFTRAA
ncbi:hypothetical protein C8R43DRAFT_833798, partial [Mycena crocata]